MSEPVSRVLVTGAAGFVGAALVGRLNADGKFGVHAAVREIRLPFPPGVTVHCHLELAAATDWAPCLTGIDCIVHAAARVHVMQDSAADPLTEFRKVNVEGTLRLARQAASAGVRRFVYLSSIKVNGESTEPGKPFVEDDQPAPRDPYGVSKLEAELGLKAVSRDTGMEVVILRPPLVYGPGVGGNFIRLMHLVDRRFPLPFGSVSNRRSLIFLGNLVEAIEVCLTHPAAAGKTYMVSDGPAVSTAELIGKIGRVLGRSPRLLPFPPALLQRMARLIGKSEEFDRLLGTLEIDSSRIRKDLDWRPSKSMEEGLQMTADWYQAS